jgi:hypothetical protein
LFLDDHRGIYIPRDFAASVVRERVVGVTDESYAYLADPSSESYWDAWQEVCDKATLTGTDGTIYHLYQDGALWLVPAGMEMDVHGSWYWPITVGDELLATGPGECFETGAVYTVVAVYDGKMDLECVALDTTVAGVQIDDPNLQPYSEAR